MAATSETSKPDRNRKWYQADLTEVNEPIRKLLENYSKVPSDKVIQHVNQIRERGFASNPYPCIGLYRFLNLTLLTHPLYPTILKRLRASPEATYLDLGCCFGQDLRQLVQDGVPSERLTGLDVEGTLMECGYDFFLDRGTLRSRFVVADVFEGNGSGSAVAAAGQGAEEWARLEERGVDVLHCSAFFHLFTLERQVAAATKIARLVKRMGVLVGRQIGSVVPGDVPAISEGSVSYRHDVATFGDMWKRVGEATCTRWEVCGSMDLVGINPQSPVEDENSRRLLFTVTRLE